MAPDSNDVNAFEPLITALSEHLRIPLEGADRSVIIGDDAEAIQLVVDMATEADKVYLIKPLLDFPATEAALARMAIDAQHMSDLMAQA